MKNSLLHVVEYTQPGEGPSGYLYNLRKALESAGILGTYVDIFALSNSDERTDSQASKSKGNLDKLLISLGPDISLQILLWRYILLHWKRPLEKPVSEFISNHKAVVFHSARFAFRYLLNSFSPEQKIFIMLHQPTNFAVELVDDWQLRYGNTSFASKAISKLAGLELETYLRVSGVVTTTNRSLDAYFDFDSRMKRKFMNEVEIHEIPSGVPPLIPTKSQLALRQELGISQDAFVIGFFGRFHPHKGFDLFTEAAKLAYESKQPYVFLTAGAGSLKPPTHLPNFINLGWRQDIANVVKIVDLVTIPNRVANFDLLALEAMSLGKAILASAVGGNIYLSSTAQGVHLFENLTPKSLLQSIKMIDRSKAQKDGEINREIYEKMYDVNAFIDRHLNFASQVLTSENKQEIQMV